MATEDEPLVVDDPYHFMDQRRHVDLSESPDTLAPHEITPMILGSLNRIKRGQLGIHVFYQNIPPEQLKYVSEESDMVMVLPDTFAARVIRYIQEQSGYMPSTIQRKGPGSLDPATGRRTRENHDIIVVIG